MKRSPSPGLLPAALLGVLLAALPGQETPPQARVFLEGKERLDFLAKIEDRMSGVRSFAADFEQEKTLRIFKDTVRSWGFLLFERPDRLRWETRRPFRSILVVAGDDVAKFEYVGGERRALKLGRGADAILIVMDQIRSWFLGKFREGAKYYEVDVAEKPAPLVVLRPKDSYIKRGLKVIEVELDEKLGMIRKVTILDPGGDRIVMSFTEKRRNGEFPPGTFSASDPVEIDPGEIEKPPPAGNPPKD